MTPTSSHDTRNAMRFGSIVPLETDTAGDDRTSETFYDDSNWWKIVGLFRVMT